MKTFLSVYFFLSFAIFAFPQNTFNIREVIIPPASVMTSVYPTDSCYYATAIISPDSIDVLHSGIAFLKLGMDGKILENNVIAHPEDNIEPWRGTLFPLNDGNFIKSGNYFDTVMNSFLAKIDRYGNLLFLEKYNSIYAPDHYFIKTVDLSFYLNENNILTINEVENPLPSINSEISLIYTDSVGQEIWQTPFGNQLNDVPISSVFDEKSEEFIIGAVRNNLNITTSGYSSRTWIFAVDSEGELKWEYLSPQYKLEGGARDILQKENGGLIVLSTKGTEEELPGGSNDLLWNGAYIYELDTFLQKTWEIEFTAPKKSFLTRIKKLVSATTNDGYVAGGHALVDSIHTGLTTYVNGWLLKISTQGDSLWSRYYNYVGANEWSHIEVSDLRACPDGGYIMCGDGKDFSGQTQYLQQGWWIKVDQHGCLVPGCHLVDTREVEKQRVAVSVYPNPCSEAFYVYIAGQQDWSEGQFTLVNSSGQVALEFTNHLPQTTHIISTGNIPSGIYFLQYRKEGRLIDQSKIIIQH